MNYLLSLLTAVTIALGIRIVGTMLISSMIIFPAVTALQVTNSFRSTLWVAVVTAVLSVIFGVLSSFVFNLPSGATIVIINGFFFMAAYIYRKLVLKN
jgi:zinc transport system permease protein